MRNVLLCATLALAACQNAPQPGADRSQAVRGSLPQDAQAALTDLKDLGAAETAQYQIRGSYANVEELKRIGFLAAQWPRSGYAITCDAQASRFTCTADPKSGEHYFYVDATQQVRYAKGGRAGAASQALGSALAN